MTLVFLGYLFVFALSAVLCFLSVPRAMQIKHTDTRRGFVAFLLSVGIWASSYVVYLGAPIAEVKVTAFTVGYIFALVSVGAWLYFCAAYTGRQPRNAPYRRVILGAFLVGILLKMTNPIHHLFYTTDWASVPFRYLAIQYGTLYWVALGLSYAVVAVGLWMLLERFHYAGADTRPLVGLVGLTAVPAAVTVLAGQSSWLLPLMYEPPGVALFALGTLFLYFDRFETIQYAAETTKPTIFIDHGGHVRDFNRAAVALFPELDESFGRSIETLLPSLSFNGTHEALIQLERAGEQRDYQVSRNPSHAGETTPGELLTVTEVTEREQYRRQLENRTSQLEALNRVVRHDIRNDMAVILLWAEQLEAHVDDEGQAALDHVLKKANHVVELTEITKEFIDSLSEDGAPELKALEVREQLDIELTAARESYPDAEFRVSGDIPAVSVQATEMLSSVLRNLLNNAAQHNDAETPEITISVEERAETVRITVADNGIGIPDGQKEEIFGKGEKGLESSGTGIGLYLVHVLTEQWGGNVWVEETGSTGSVFVVELQKAE